MEEGHGSLATPLKLGTFFYPSRPWFVVDVQPKRSFIDLFPPSPIKSEM